MEVRFSTLIKGIFLDRLNRFAAKVLIGEEEYVAHVPNSGRMNELLIPGNVVWLNRHFKSNRKTPYDLILVEHQGHLVAVDSRLANELTAELIQRGKLDIFKNISYWKREVRYEGSRFDFFLVDEEREVWLETKSVNLVIEGAAMFPDAPTDRGTRHVLELLKLHRQGFRSIILFIILRSDADRFKPHGQRDPAFYHALGQAIQEGVEVYAYTCNVHKDGISLGGIVPVSLE